jgi:flagellar M-ring protein FliF
MPDGANKSTPEWGQQALALVHRGHATYQALPEQRRSNLMRGGLLLLGMIAALAWFLNRPDWRVLYSNLEARDSGTVVQELSAAGIEFRLTSDQTGIEVPTEMLNKARMEVAAKGMPATGRLGFELFDKPNWVGSEFDEKVNYQRALEGELEHTIGSLSAVKAARVHLVLPEPSLFTRQEQGAKASVVLKLKRTTIDPEQADAVRRMVAGAVANLQPEDVTLLDADGRADFTAKNSHAHQGDEEQVLSAKLIAMLEPAVGAGNVRAIVNAEYDEGSEERTEEVYDPTSVVTLSMQKMDQSSVPGGSGVRASGVPGTASNTPAASSTGAVQGSTTAAAPALPPLLQANAKDPLPVYPDRSAGGGQTMRQETGTYGATKRTLHREDGPGRLRRLTVAVLINDRWVSGNAWKPRNSEEMHRLEVLAQAAIGFEAKRGDLVTLENVSFTSNLPGAPITGLAKVGGLAQGFLQDEPGALRAVVLGFVGLMTIVLVLRPISKQIVKTIREPASIGSGAAHRRGLAYEQAGPSPTIGDTTPEKLETLNPAVIEEVAEYIRKKPVLSTRLLESWIDGPKEAS